MLFVLGEVTPFVGVGADVVEFLIAAGVADVAEAFGAEAEAAGLGQVREGNVRPISVGGFQEWQQAWAVMMRMRRQTGELGERGREAEQADGFVADAGARAGRQARGALGHAQDERHAGAHAPSGEFLPVLFFAEMPAVIGPERDDGVAGVGPFLQSIEHVAEHGVGKVNGGEVTLHGGFPLLVFADVGEVTIGPAAFAFGRQVVEVVGLVAGRQLDGVQRKRLEIFLGHEPRLVRAVDAAGEEERAVVLFGELLADPLGDEKVAAIFFVGGVQRRPVGLDVLPRLTRNAHGPLLGIERAWEGIFGFLFREILVPRLGVDEVV